jgi:hypothetical protein
MAPPAPHIEDALRSLRPTRRVFWGEKQPRDDITD